MYEEITYERLLRRMLDRITVQNPNIDTREGSLVYNAIAPAAVELQNMYIALDQVLNETFADSASREMLIKRAAERGIEPEQATHAIRKGEFNMGVPIGARFSHGLLNYTAIAKISGGIYQMQCETPGYQGNVESGNLIPIEYIEGLERGTLSDVLIPGEDEEDTEHLRQRYFATLNSQAFGGNVTDYKEKVQALDGVGGVKVYPVWNGGGTVKLVLVDATYGKPSHTLVAAVQEAIDPLEHRGRGMGIAPIGHQVTAVACGETEINIQSSITLQEGWSWEDVLPYVQTAVDTYFTELGETWAQTENLIVRISQIETRLLDLTVVLDITETTLNGAGQNLTLVGDNIPVRGSIINVR